MKKSTLVLFLLFVIKTVSVQEVLSMQGETCSNAIENISFTIGVVIINTGAAGTAILTQGFHQTNWNCSISSY